MSLTITSSEELAQIFIENLINNTSKITKVSDGSIVGAIAQANGKLANLILKDISIIQSGLFVDTATGDALDEYAKREGFPSRFGPNGSSTFIRLVGAPGTTYLSGTHFLTSSNGLLFTFSANVTIPSFGYIYARISSTTTGQNTNVPPLSITKISPSPVGHIYCINEYAAIGGQDSENDDNFRERLIKGANILSRDTLSFYEQLFMKFNNRVLRLVHLGTNSSSKVVLGIVCVDGGLLTSDELLDLTKKSEKYFSLRDYRPNGTTGDYGVLIQNMNFQAIDFDFRIKINTNFIQDDVRKDIQIALNKIYDYRFWDSNIVEWDDALQTVKSVDGVDYVNDEFFKINTQAKDLTLQAKYLPRVRSFVMRDLDNNILVDLSGNLNPTYFNNQPDSLFQTTIG